MKTTATIVLDFNDSEFEEFTDDLKTIQDLNLEYGLWMPGYPEPDEDASIRRISDGTDYYPCMVFSLNAESDEYETDVYQRFLSLLRETGLKKDLRPDSHSVTICNLNNLNDWTQDYCYSDLDIIEAALRKKAELFRTPWLIEKYIGEHAEEL